MRGSKEGESMEKIKLLLVDDNKQLTSMIEEYFSSNHASIEVRYIAGDGEEGLKLLREKQPDIVISTPIDSHGVFIGLIVYIP